MIMNYLRMTMLAAAVLLSACPELGTQERTLTAELPENPSWAVDVKPILDLYCNECHSSPPTQLATPGIRLDVCENVGTDLGAQSQAIRIQFRTLDQVPTPMPPLSYGIYPSNDEQEILQRWIDQGAQCDGVAPTNVTPNNTQPDMNTTTVDMAAVDMAVPVDMGTDTGVDTGPDLPPPATWAMVSQLLVTKCAGCHDAGRQNLTIPMGGTPAEVQATVEGMSANTGDMNLFITPNSPAASEIYLRVTSMNMAFRMPPNSAAVDQELATALESWILSGAPYN